MNPLTQTLLIITLSTSTILVTASHHWLLAWLGLELNTLSILPIIIKPAHPRATEATIKYFLIQTTAAAMILFAGTLNTWQTGQWTITHVSSPQTITIITIALLLKLGLAPMHLWYPDVLQGTTMNTALILSTWQKLAPLALLITMSNHLPSNMLLLFGLLSALIGGWLGLNQTQVRKILAASSIAHMGWLITALAISPPLTTLTLLIYIITTVTVFSHISTTETKTTQDISTMWTHSPALVLTMTLALVSLGGLPPTTGFIPKWLILKDMLTANLAPLALGLLLASLPSLFFYLRLMYISTLTAPPTTTTTEYKWRLKITPKKNLTSLMTLATLLLPLTPMIYNTT
uniref:NADH-ubiquinone oxidoreductase chain 2 n=1 Tax=Cnemaspis leucura TaxID=2691893 RepID=A0A1V1G147_9SAUR|nr:NAHD dehydrogenase subunit 2 [Cnemaspis leucura]BAX08269.1 NAHD dehydrogenase subunit 2 [Cnemaspis leucura]BAX08270.1 NAHD dehydrogenase subunit 2 [Cnemaspis leucura]BAX08271.1 NAHD dehydrogenase subunit 2 [Cnemaspis leucura]